MTLPQRDTPDPRTLRSAYIFGIFSMALIDVFVFLIPVYAGITLGMSDGEIGTLVGARSLISLFLSIHAGVLMDRFGVRRITLIFTGIVVICAPLFPLMTTFQGLLLLQFISGFAISMAWSGGQTLIARIADGDAEYIGRFSSFARIGTTVAPPIVGFLFDLGGAWLAYGFGMVWAMCAFSALYMAGEPKIATTAPTIAAPHLRLKDIMPRASDYAASFAMMAIPAVAFAAVAMLVRNSSYGIQTSVYVTHLEDIGFSATLIGFLFAGIEMAAAVGAWFAGRTMRRFEAIRILVITTTVTIVLISITPLITSVTPILWVMFVVLVTAQMARGMTQGVSQPILFSVMAKSVGAHQQGAVVGLRQTMNRLGGITIPPLIGILSDTVGREESFYITGGILLFICLGLALYARHVPPIKG